MKAIISDVHSNWEALQAVLQDAARNGAREVYCLGDMVGYGPDPRACLDLLQYLEFPVVLMGNHDQAVLGQAAHGFNPRARDALRWTQTELFAPKPDAAAPERRRRFLAQRPLVHEEGDFLFVHGSPRDPLSEYVYPEDAGNPRKMGELFARVPRYCFMGHTHVPGIFTTDLCFHTPADLVNGYRLTGGKVMCNVGSVGQSRDGDGRACYVLLDGDHIEFRRVRYDIHSTVEKIRAVKELDPTLWARVMGEDPPSRQRRTTRVRPIPTRAAGN